MKNLIVGQSGGPTAVINSSLYGVIREGFNRSEEIEHVYGMINGIQGFLDGRFMDMKELDNDTLEALRTTPGAYLGSCRFKLPDDLNDAIYPLLFQKFEEMNIGYFFYIGGSRSKEKLACIDLCICRDWKLDTADRRLGGRFCRIKKSICFRMVKVQTRKQNYDGNNEIKQSAI